MGNLIKSLSRGDFALNGNVVMTSHLEAFHGMVGSVVPNAIGTGPFSETDKLDKSSYDRGVIRYLNVNIKVSIEAK